MAVSARFWVDEITTRAYNPDHAVVVLQPTCRGEGNKAWAEATPSGRIELSITNPAAAAWFKARQGRDVAITFDDVSDDDGVRSSQYQD